jgi:DNA polymerase III epsilon subunit-like protein
MAHKYKSNSNIAHLNGNVMCSIDTETTGLDCTFHELIQIAVLPLTDSFEVDDRIDPFVCLMKPDYPDRWDPKAASVNGLFEKANKHGLDRGIAFDLFKGWFREVLKIPETMSPPYTKQIAPLAQNWTFDYGFINAWMGEDLDGRPFLDDFITRREPRDTKIVCAYLNDLAYMNNERCPFPRYSLGALCDRLCIPHPNKHDALGDAEATAKVYQRLAGMPMIHGLDLGIKLADTYEIPPEMKIKPADLIDPDNPDGLILL